MLKLLNFRKSNILSIFEIKVGFPEIKKTGRKYRNEQISRYIDIHKTKNSQKGFNLEYLPKQKN